MIPSYKVKAIDTCGAGDSFNGGFAYALTRVVIYLSAQDSEML